jgi:Flp pilus assembly pilin Flp
MPKLLCSALRNEVGATAIEYALIVSFVSVLIIAAWGLLGEPILGVFALVADAL